MRGFSGEIRYHESLAAHTTFRAGGPADIWVQPGPDRFSECAASLLGSAAVAGIPVFILGGGANIVVSGRGIRGMVLDTRSWSGWEIEGDKVLVRSGTPVDDLAEGLGGRGFAGLEFLAGMPGTVGGAVWMNARCYDREIAGPLLETEVLEPDRFGTWRPHWIPREPLDFAYKKSPFQGSRALILNARFALERRDPAELRRVMAGYCKDRKEKGHYRYPSAGSAFKNNRDFGKPTGKIIDELGLRGLSLGGAQVAPWHGNLIINTGTASAGDIRGLVETLQDRVRDSLGLELEPEILFVGDWDAPATGP